MPNSLITESPLSLTQQSDFKRTLVTHIDGSDSLKSRLVDELLENPKSDAFYVLLAGLGLVGPVSLFVMPSFIFASALTLSIYIYTVMISTACLGLIALGYLINQWVENIDRLTNHEGWHKPLALFVTSLVFGLASFAAFCLFPAQSLLLIAIFSESLPFLIAFFVTGISVPLISAAVGIFIADKTYNASNDADAERFQLAVDEEVKLMNKGIDPIQVRCAIIALHTEMSSRLKGEATIPGFFSRKYGRGSCIQPLLEQVRQLRRGELSEISVGESHFDCRISSPIDQANRVQSRL